MSYFDNYKELLPLYELYLSGFKKAFENFNYQNYIETHKDRVDFSDDEYKVYSMCKLVVILDDVIECLKTDDRERFDSLEPVLHYWLKDTIKYVPHIQ